MKNNKRSMKLYTEEQVRFIIGRAQILGLDDDFLFNEDYLIEQAESIELPSDEEMVKEKYEHEICVFADEYASYILDQSKLGIKGAMVSMCAWTFFNNRRNDKQ